MRTAGSRGSSLGGPLADPGPGSRPGTAVLLLTAVAVRRDRVGPGEAAAFRAVIGLARIYVGAHLPLDVVGGAALGLAIDAASMLAIRSRRRFSTG